MPEFMNVDALMAAFGQGWNDLASALIVVVLLCIFAAVELFRAR